MPFMDGFETCKRLKGMPETQDIPVIFVTAKTEAEDVIKGLRMGAVDYVIKPYNFKELLVRVNNTIEMARSSKELKNLLQAHTVKVQETNRLLGNAKEDAKIKSYMNQLRLVIPSQTKLVKNVLTFLGDCYQSICENCKINAYHIEISISEALINAIVHGNLEVPSSIKQNDWDRFDKLGFSKK